MADVGTSQAAEAAATGSLVQFAFASVGLGILIVYYLFFAARVWGIVLTSIINFFVLGRDQHIKIASINFAILGGRIIIRGLNYTTKNTSLRAVDCNVYIKWWKRIPADDIADVTTDDQGQGQPCRIQVELIGAEYLIYNNSYKADEMRDILNKRESGDDAFFSHTENAGTIDTEIPWYHIFSPAINYSVKQGSLIIGNPKLFYMTIVAFKECSGMITTQTAPWGEDPYRSVTTATMINPKMTVIQNEDFEGQINIAARQQNETEDFFSNALDDFRSFFKDMRFAFGGPDDAPHRSKTDKHEPRTKFPTSSAATGGTQWSGLPRYFKSLVRNYEYASDEAVLCADSISLQYYYDVPGIIRITDNLSSYEETAPKLGIDVTATNTNVIYGPWTERQRVAFMLFFYPPEFEMQQKFLPAPGLLRQYTIMNIKITFAGDTTMKVPFREFSKDDKLDSLDACEPEWISINSSSESVLDWDFPWTCLTDDGNASVINLSLNDCDIITSLTNTSFITCDNWTTHFVMRYPVAWNDQTDWEIGLDLQSPKVFLLYNHITLFKDLVADWTYGAEPVDLRHFVPCTYSYKINLNDYELLCNVNEQNIIFDPNTDLDLNAHMCFYGPNMAIDMHTPYLKFQSPNAEVKYEISMQEMGIRLHLPKANSIRQHFPDLSSADFIRVGTFTLSGSYLYHYKYNETYLDSMLLFVDMHDVDVTMFGFYIRYLLFLKDNFFGYCRDSAQLHERVAQLREQQQNQELQRMKQDKRYQQKFWHERQHIGAAGIGGATGSQGASAGVTPNTRRRGSSFHGPPPADNGITGFSQYSRQYIDQINNTMSEEDSNVGNIYTPENRFEFYVHISITNTQVKLPPFMYNSKESAVITAEEILFENRAITEYQDMFVSISPLKIKVPVSEEVNLSPFLTSYDIVDRSYIAVDGLVFKLFSLYGPPPEETTYKTTMKLTVGEIAAQLLPIQLIRIADWSSCFQFHLANRENAIATEFAAQVDPVIDKLYLHTDRIHVGIWGNNSVSEVHLSEGIILETDTTINRMYHEKTQIAVAELLLKHMSPNTIPTSKDPTKPHAYAGSANTASSQSASGVGSSAPDASHDTAGNSSAGVPSAASSSTSSSHFDTGKWYEVGTANFSFSLSVYTKKATWELDAWRQLEFLRSQDDNPNPAKRRIPEIWNEPDDQHNPEFDSFYRDQVDQDYIPSESDSEYTDMAEYDSSAFQSALSINDDTNDNLSESINRSIASGQQTPKSAGVPVYPRNRSNSGATMAQDMDVSSLSITSSSTNKLVSPPPSVTEDTLKAHQNMMTDGDDASETSYRYVQDSEDGSSSSDESYDSFGRHRFVPQSAINHESSPDSDGRYTSPVTISDIQTEGSDTKTDDDSDTSTFYSAPDEFLYQDAQGEWDVDEMANFDIGDNVTVSSQDHQQRDTESESPSEDVFVDAQPSFSRQSSSTSTGNFFTPENSLDFDTESDVESQEFEYEYVPVDNEPPFPQPYTYGRRNTEEQIIAAGPTTDSGAIHTNEPDRRNNGRRFTSDSTSSMGEQGPKPGLPASLTSGPIPNNFDIAGDISSSEFHDLDMDESSESSSMLEDDDDDYWHASTDSEDGLRRGSSESSGTMMHAYQSFLKRYSFKAQDDIGAPFQVDAPRRNVTHEKKQRMRHKQLLSVLTVPPAAMWNESASPRTKRKSTMSSATNGSFHSGGIPDLDGYTPTHIDMEDYMARGFARAESSKPANDGQLTSAKEGGETTIFVLNFERNIDLLVTPEIVPGIAEVLEQFIPKSLDVDAVLDKLHLQSEAEHLAEVYKKQNNSTQFILSLPSVNITMLQAVYSKNDLVHEQPSKRTGRSRSRSAPRRSDQYGGRKHRRHKAPRRCAMYATKIVLHQIHGFYSLGYKTGGSMKEGRIGPLESIAASSFSVSNVLMYVGVLNAPNSSMKRFHGIPLDLMLPGLPASMPIAFFLTIEETDLEIKLEEKKDYHQKNAASAAVNHLTIHGAFECPQIVLGLIGIWSLHINAFSEVLSRFEEANTENLSTVKEFPLVDQMIDDHAVMQFEGSSSISDKSIHVKKLRKTFQNLSKDDLLAVRASQRSLPNLFSAIDEPTTSIGRTGGQSMTHTRGEDMQNRDAVDTAVPATSMPIPKPIKPMKPMKLHGPVAGYDELTQRNTLANEQQNGNSNENATRVPPAKPRKLTSTSADWANTARFRSTRGFDRDHSHRATNPRTHGHKHSPSASSIQVNTGSLGTGGSSSNGQDDQEPEFFAETNVSLDIRSISLSVVKNSELCNTFSMDPVRASTKIKYLSPPLALKQRNKLEPSLLRDRIEQQVVLDITLFVQFKKIAINITPSLLLFIDKFSRAENSKGVAAPVLATTSVDETNQIRSDPMVRRGSHTGVHPNPSTMESPPPLSRSQSNMGLISNKKLSAQRRLSTRLQESAIGRKSSAIPNYSGTIAGRRMHPVLLVDTSMQSNASAEDLVGTPMQGTGISNPIADFNDTVDPSGVAAAISTVEREKVVLLINAKLEFDEISGIARTKSDGDISLTLSKTSVSLEQYDMTHGIHIASSRPDLANKHNIEKASEALLQSSVIVSIPKLQLTLFKREANQFNPSMFDKRGTLFDMFIKDLMVHQVAYHVGLDSPSGEPTNARPWVNMDDPVPRRKESSILVYLHKGMDMKLPSMRLNDLEQVLDFFKAWGEVLASSKPAPTLHVSGSTSGVPNVATEGTSSLFPTPVPTTTPILNENSLRKQMQRKNLAQKMAGYSIPDPTLTSIAEDTDTDVNANQSDGIVPGGLDIHDIDIIQTPKQGEGDLERTWSTTPETDDAPYASPKFGIKQVHVFADQGDNEEDGDNSGEGNEDEVAGRNSIDSSENEFDDDDLDSGTSTLDEEDDGVLVSQPRDVTRMIVDLHGVEIHTNLLPSVRFKYAIRRLVGKVDMEMDGNMVIDADVVSHALVFDNPSQEQYDTESSSSRSAKHGGRGHRRAKSNGAFSLELDEHRIDLARLQGSFVLNNVERHLEATLLLGFMHNTINAALFDKLLTLQSKLKHEVNNLLEEGLTLAEWDTANAFNMGSGANYDSPPAGTGGSLKTPTQGAGKGAIADDRSVGSDLEEKKPLRMSVRFAMHGVRLFVQSHATQLVFNTGQVNVHMFSRSNHPGAYIWTGSLNGISLDIGPIPGSRLDMDSSVGTGGGNGSTLSSNRSNSSWDEEGSGGGKRRRRSMSRYRYGAGSSGSSDGGGSTGNGGVEGVRYRNSGRDGRSTHGSGLGSADDRRAVMMEDYHLQIPVSSLRNGGGATGGDTSPLSPRSEGPGSRGSSYGGYGGGVSSGQYSAYSSPRSSIGLFGNDLGRSTIQQVYTGSTSVFKTDLRIQNYPFTKRSAQEIAFSQDDFEASIAIEDDDDEGVVQTNGLNLWISMDDTDLIVRPSFSASLLSLQQHYEETYKQLREKHKELAQQRASTPVHSSSSTPTRQMSSQEGGERAVGDQMGADGIPDSPVTPLKRVIEIVDIQSQLNQVRANPIIKNSSLNIKMSNSTLWLPSKMNEDGEALATTDTALMVSLEQIYLFTRAEAADSADSTNEFLNLRSHLEFYSLSANVVDGSDLLLSGDTTLKMENSKHGTLTLPHGEMQVYMLNKSAEAAKSYQFFVTAESEGVQLDVGSDIMSQYMVFQRSWKGERQYIKENQESSLDLSKQPSLEVDFQLNVGQGMCTMRRLHYEESVRSNSSGRSRSHRYTMGTRAEKDVLSFDLPGLTTKVKYESLVHAVAFDEDDMPIFVKENSTFVHLLVKEVHIKLSPVVIEIMEEVNDMMTTGSSVTGGTIGATQSDGMEASTGTPGNSLKILVDMKPASLALTCNDTSNNNNSGVVLSLDHQGLGLCFSTASLKRQSRTKGVQRIQLPVIIAAHLNHLKFSLVNERTGFETMKFSIASIEYSYSQSTGFLGKAKIEPHLACIDAMELTLSLRDLSDVGTLQENWLNPLQGKGVRAGSSAKSGSVGGRSGGGWGSRRSMDGMSDHSSVMSGSNMVAGSPMKRGGFLGKRKKEYHCYYLKFREVKANVDLGPDIGLMDFETRRLHVNGGIPRRWKKTDELMYLMMTTDTHVPSKITLSGVLKGKIELGKLMFQGSILSSQYNSIELKNFFVCLQPTVIDLEYKFNQILAADVGVIQGWFQDSEDSEEFESESVVVSGYIMIQRMETQVSNHALSAAMEISMSMDKLLTGLYGPSSSSSNRQGSSSSSSSSRRTGKRKKRRGKEGQLIGPDGKVIPIGEIKIDGWDWNLSLFTGPRSFKEHEWVHMVLHSYKFHLTQKVEYESIGRFLKVLLGPCYVYNLSETKTSKRDFSERLNDASYSRVFRLPASLYRLSSTQLIGDPTVEMDFNSAFDGPIEVSLDVRQYAYLRDTFARFSDDYESFKEQLQANTVVVSNVSEDALDSRQYVIVGFELNPQLNVVGDYTPQISKVLEWLDINNPSTTISQALHNSAVDGLEGILRSLYFK